ncbi:MULTISPECIES: nitrile hydratase accessory protein [unclassified Paenibacillus]|uniref:nitrile hydratase accessory protein n=1 Tax=unclassified Paenibacillus TaxID=185978 RepID=UPI001AE53847|nr:MULTISPECIES: nitrile hydratase accessory protein [unclassified Paenibacillus]MBP1155600.1 nitrile hydratase accessory protein [Paenibacillus sp. PvP091]MBP1169014.1 nitrile hydratase accessory protein [Paenibacillus sp. PvR098]MBP2440042.1 nitrile hydratase accessory protein [Paenibacillus sp. PvP052]
MEKSCEVQSAETWLAYMPEGVTPPRKNGELNFQEPWESRSFGMAIALYDQKHYTSWDDFRTRLVEEIGEWESAESKDAEAWNYYDHWMAALERLVVETGMIDQKDIDVRTEEFLSGERESF